MLSSYILFSWHGHITLMLYVREYLLGWVTTGVMQLRLQEYKLLYHTQFKGSDE